MMNYSDNGEDGDHEQPRKGSRCVTTLAMFIEHLRVHASL